MPRHHTRNPGQDATSRFRAPQARASRKRTYASSIRPRACAMLPRSASAQNSCRPSLRLRARASIRLRRTRPRRGDRNETEAQPAYPTPCSAQSDPRGQSPSAPARKSRRCLLLCSRYAKEAPPRDIIDCVVEELQIQVVGVPLDVDQKTTDE
jgi:hypothetical protein